MDWLNPGFVCLIFFPLTANVVLNKVNLESRNLEITTIHWVNNTGWGHVIPACIIQSPHPRRGEVGKPVHNWCNVQPAWPLVATRNVNKQYFFYVLGRNQPIQCLLLRLLYGNRSSWFSTNFRHGVDDVTPPNRKYFLPSSTWRLIEITHVTCLNAICACLYSYANQKQPWSNNVTSKTGFNLKYYDNFTDCVHCHLEAETHKRVNLMPHRPTQQTVKSYNPVLVYYYVGYIHVHKINCIGGSIIEMYRLLLISSSRLTCLFSFC